MEALSVAARNCRLCRLELLACGLSCPEAKMPNVPVCNMCDQMDRRQLPEEGDRAMQCAIPRRSLLDQPRQRLRVWAEVTLSATPLPSLSICIQPGCRHLHVSMLAKGRRM